MHVSTFVAGLYRPHLNRWLNQASLVKCAQRQFHPVSLPSAPRRPRWNASEDAALITAANENQKYDDIAKLFPNRTVDGVKCRIKLLQRSGALQPKPTKRWSAEEDAILKDARRRGLSLREVSELLPGRSRRCIRSHVLHMTYTDLVDLDKKHVPYSPEEDAELKHCRNVLGLSYPTIATRLPGRPSLSLRHRYRAITPAAERGKPRQERWRDDEVQKLKLLLGTGMAHATIAAVLGRTSRAVSHKIDYMQYETERRSMNGRLNRRWSVEENTRLCELYAEGHKSAQIARELQRSVAAVYSKIYEHGLLRRPRDRS